MEFKVVATQEDVQTAVMRLAQGEASGAFGNEHGASAQVLVVIRGEVDAEVGKKRFRMRAGESTIVGRSIEHRFIGASEEQAVTLNVYCPPAYDDRMKRDRSGEPFQNALTENTGAPRQAIEQAQHQLTPD